MHTYVFTFRYLWVQISFIILLFDHDFIYLPNLFLCHVLYILQDKGNLGKMGNLKLQFFVIFKLLFIVLAYGNSCPWDLPDLQLWSDYSTWDGPPPSKGENILVTKNILLDLETPELGTIKIIDGGMIIFSPNHQVYLDFLFQKAE